MRQWSLARLLLAAGVILSLVTMTGIAAVLWSTSHILDVLEHQTAALLEDEKTAGRIVRGVRRQVNAARSSTSSPEELAAFRMLGDSIQQDISRYIGRDLPSKERRVAARIQDLHGMVESSLQRPSTNEQVVARRRLQVDSLGAEMDRLIALRYARHTDLAARSTAFMKLLLMTSSALGVLVLVAALSILRLLYRRIVVRLHGMADAAQRVGAGDFTARVAESENDELADVSQRFNRMARQLHAGSAKAEEMNSALRESEERYRSLFDRVPVGLYRTSREGLLLDANSRFLVVLGYDDLAAVQATSVGAALDPEARRHWQRSIEATDDVLEIVWRLQRPDHAERWVHEAARAIRDEHGVVQYYEGVVRDITEAVQTDRALRSSEQTHRELESQLMQAQKMEAIGRLAGGIAHDFNNLLTAISGYADLMREEDEQLGRGRHDVGEIQKAVQRGARLTSQLLAFSSYRVTQTGPNDLGAVTQDVEQMLRRLIGENIGLRTSLRQGIWVASDLAQLEQILINLVVNARDAIADSGHIQVTVDETALDEAAGRPVGLGAGRYVRLKVSDDGCGMTPDVVAHAFEPFFTTKPVGQGTGLGLSTVYGIIQQARGGISVESEPGRGTTFTIYLPRTSPPANAPQALPPGGSDTGGSELLLVVEDEPAVRALARRILERKGYRVLVAGNGLEAMGVVQSLDVLPDLVITDVVMPEMGGRVLAMHLSAIAPDIKVLYMSGYTADAFSPEDGEHAIHFIEKPFTPAELIGKIRAVLDAATVGAV